MSEDNITITGKRHLKKQRAYAISVIFKSRAMTEYLDYKKALEEYRQEKINGGTLIDSLISSVTDENASIIISAVPDYLNKSFWNCVESAPSTDEGWRTNKGISSNGEFDNPLDKNNPYRVGIEIIRKHKEQ